jgi:hypothetical protein
MRVAIAFFGITRSLTYTAESIRRNVIEPARQLADVRLFGHFYSQSEIDNPRSGESGQLRLDEHRLLCLDEVKFEAPFESIEAICNVEKLSPDKIIAAGDAWNDGFKSLANLLHQLHSLRYVALMAEQYAPDVVCFVRPDLMYHDSFAPVINRALHAKKPALWVPDWQWWGGVNDRLAVCKGKDAIRDYGCRLQKIPAYLEQLDKPLHGESLVKFVVDSSRISLHPSCLRASRVRSNGLHVLEPFEDVSKGEWTSSPLGRFRRLFRRRSAPRLSPISARSVTID